MMNTELRQLRHIAALAKHLNFTNAAKELCITQSTLTRSIQGFEDMAGVRLFDRDRGRVRLTQIGQTYSQRAAELLRDAAEMDRLLVQTASADAGEVQFGVTPVIAHAVMPQAMTAALQHCPELRANLMIRAANSLLDLVQNETIEFCICSERAEAPKLLRQTVLGAVPFSLIVRKDHPLRMHPDRFHPRDFPLMLAGQLMQFNGLPSQVRPILNWPPQILSEDYDTLAQIAAHTDMIWLSSAWLISHNQPGGALASLTHPDLGALGEFRVVLYSHQRRSLSPVANRLIANIRQQVGNLAKSAAQGED